MLLKLGGGWNLLLGWQLWVWSVLQRRCPLVLPSILQVLPILPKCLLVPPLPSMLGRHSCVSPWHVDPTMLVSVRGGMLRTLQQLPNRTVWTGLPGP